MTNLSGENSVQMCKNIQGVLFQLTKLKSAGILLRFHYFSNIIFENFIENHAIFACHLFLIQKTENNTGAKIPGQSTIIFTLLWITCTENNIKKEVKHFWSFITNQKCTRSIPLHMHFNQSTADDTESICNLYLDYFDIVFESSTIFHLL